MDFTMDWKISNCLDNSEDGTLFWRFILIMPTILRQNLNQSKAQHTVESTLLFFGVLGIEPGTNQTPPLFPYFFLFIISF